MYNLPGITWLYFVIWLVIVLTYYLVWARRQSALNRPDADCPPCPTP